MADYMNDIAGCEIPLKELYETSQHILDVEHGAIAELYKRLENAEEMTTTELALSIIASEKYKAQYQFDRDGETVFTDMLYYLKCIAGEE